MLKINYLMVLGAFVISFGLYAQVPDLPVKNQLSDTLHGAKRFNNPNAPDVITIPFSPDGDYTLEVKASVRNAGGRGLDVELRDDSGLGIRTTLDNTSFNYTSPLTQSKNLSTSVDNDQEQTYRYVVEGKTAHIYQDGRYVASNSLRQIGAVIEDEEVFPTEVYGEDSELGPWAGRVGDNAGAPDDYGWSNTSTSSLFNTANGSGGVRYMDVTSGHIIESDGSTFNGRLMYIRWDGNSYSSSAYTFPVALREKTSYKFSWIYELVANANPGVSITVSIAKNSDGGDVIASETFVTGSAFSLREGDFSFISQEEGAYYLTITGNWALFGIGNLKLESPNLVNKWDGLSGDDSASPDSYGWSNSVSSAIFSTANGSGGVNYRDVTSGHTFESDGSAFQGRLMYIRWDDPSYESSTYSFPTELDEDTDYRFSWIYELIANASPGASMTLSIGTSADATGVIATKSFQTGNAFSLREGELDFRTSSAGTYYLTVTGDWALFGIGKLNIEKMESPRILIGRNYTSGEESVAIDPLDLAITSVTYEAGAFAPTPIEAPSTVDLVLTGSQTVSTYAKTNLILNDGVSLHLTSPYSPLINSQININAPEATLYFDQVSMDEVVDSFLPMVRINGAPAAQDTNVYLSAYAGGTVIAMQSLIQEPLVVFTGENFTGESRTYEVFTRYTSLDTFDNAIKSFKLKKGYMATFATSPDASGYSRVYIAEDEDLEVPVLPTYLYGKISFIRPLKWFTASKKGWCGGSAQTRQTNSTWLYNWNTGGNSSDDIEYIPMKFSYSWPNFNAIHNNPNYTHLLTYNEPVRPDQGTSTVEQAIEQWPEIMYSGLRLGSPAPADPFGSGGTWLYNFLDQCDELNYRVDFVAIHAYWNKSANQWYNDLRYVYNRVQRPLWITEWNNGANWTSHSFPDEPTLATDANMNKQLNDIKGILNVLDTTSFVERYSIYNWVQDARAILLTIDSSFLARNPDHANYQWLADATVVSSVEGTLPDGTRGPVNVVLTPAGEYYANNKSIKAYREEEAVIPKWETYAPPLSYETSVDYDSLQISWTGGNGDLIEGYTLERRLAGESDFSVFYQSSDFNVLAVDDTIHTQVDYRLRVIGLNYVDTLYSDVLTFIQDEISPAPVNLAGTPVSSSILDISWDSASRAEVYNLKRASSVEGPYTVIIAYLADTTFTDTDLDVNTTYYYKVSAVNTGGESEDSPAVAVTTNSIVTPASISGLLLGSGDAQVKLDWDFMYDAEFKIKRSSSASGPFAVIDSVSVNSYADQTVSNGSTYYYSVSAYNTAGESNDSEVFEANPGLGQHAYFSFNENDGSQAFDVWGNFTGTLKDSAFWATGHEGSAISLNEDTLSFIQLKEGVVEDLEDMTIAVWVNLNSISTWSRIVDFGIGTSVYLYLTPRSGSGTLRFGMRNGNVSQQINASALTVGEWTHVAVTLSGNTGIMYVNGVEVAINTNMPIDPSDLGNTLTNYIGKSQFGADPFLNGSVDDFRIYNRALSAAEIEALAGIQSNASARMTTEDGQGLSGVSTLNDYVIHAENQSIHVKINGKDDARYHLYTLSGVSLLKNELKLGVTNRLGRLNAGLYILKIVDNEQVLTTKVVIE